MKIGSTEIKIPKLTALDIEEMMKDKAFLKILTMSAILYKNLKHDFWYSSFLGLKINKFYKKFQ